MTTENEECLEESVGIDATAEDIWRLVSDPRRMAEWSPQVDSVRLRAGSGQPCLGTEFTNLNREGDLTWTTHGTIVRFDHAREFAFRIEENWVVWSFRIETAGPGRTQVIQQRQTPEGISDYSLDLTEEYLGGQEAFARILRAGMRQTLDRIKAAAEYPGG
jgi:uncharacterized protein YndB with AHSA1/START domain